MGSIADEARQAWRTRLLEEEAQSLAALRPAAIKAVLQVIDVSSPGLVVGSDGGYSYFEDPDLVKAVVVHLPEDDSFLVTPSVRVDTARHFMVFPIDRSEGSPGVPLGPPVTSMLTYGRTLEVGMPRDEWLASDTEELGSEAVVVDDFTH